MDGAPGQGTTPAAVLLIVIMITASVFASRYGGSLWWGLVGFFLLALSLWSFFLPTSFRMDDRGS